MSRPPGRSYADFFPTAPSVIQEKKKEAARDRRNASLDAPLDASSPPQSSCDGATPTANGATDSSHEHEHEHVSSDGVEPQRQLDSHDRVQAMHGAGVNGGDAGDLLINTVGSASSLASTASSSVFSNGLPQNLGSSTRNGAGANSSLTPLTSHELSPPARSSSPNIMSRGKSLAGHRRPYSEAFGPSEDEVHPSGQSVSAGTKLCTPSQTPQSYAKSQLFPPPGQPKGLKVVYDPDLDHKLPAKDKKKGKVQYKKFGTEESTLRVSDPRLAIPGYKSGNPNVRLTGEARTWKHRPRPAPYSFQPYAWDPAISIGPGPPTSIVVVGFDPFTPEHQIRALFGSFGDIAELENKTDPMTGIFLGLCSIRYRDSRPGRHPTVLAAVAAKRAEKEGSGQRIGTRSVRVERDRNGKRANRYVESIAKRNRERQAREASREEAVKKEQRAAEAKVAVPPPNAPKGPASRAAPPPPPLAAQPAAETQSSATASAAVKIPDGPRAASGPPPKTGAALLIEDEAILSRIRRKPYIFIAHEHVPVMGTTIPHLKRRMKAYDWREIRCDKTGYYIIFDDSKRGEEEAVRCFQGSNNQPLFTYTMVIECQQYGNPDYERSPSPERKMAIERESKEKMRVEEEDTKDLEEEKKQRAANLDPVHAALEQLRTELKEKILGDIKSRIAAPTLYNYLDPERHAEKRQKLGISDPTEQQRPQAAFLSLTGADTRVPFRNIGQGNSLMRNVMSSTISARSRQATGNAFLDERRQRPAKRRNDVRSLYHHLRQDSDAEEESDDDERKTARSHEAGDQDSSRLASRRSSVTPAADRDTDSASTPRKRQKVDGEPSPVAPAEDSGDENYGVAKSLLDPWIWKKEPEDMALRELQQVINSLPYTSKLHKRAKAELRLRQKAKDDDRLFSVKTDALVEDAGIVGTLDNLEPSILSPLENEQKTKKKQAAAAIAKGKKKSKTQMFKEREAAKAAAQAKINTELLLAVDDLATPAPTIEIEPDKLEQITPPVEEEEEEEEERAEVEWGVSTDTPRRTVEDDPDMVLDIDGWQHILKDDEDLRFLKEALRNEPAAKLGNANEWARKQKEIKTLNNGGILGIVHDQPQIKGYYIPNETGCARTEGVKKILESEKSKYLPHRIKVALARERRQAEAKRRGGAGGNVATVAAAAENLRKEKQVSSAHSRSTRATNRNQMKDIQQIFTVEGQQSDTVRFNALKKRKKLVKFDRSAIHGWGLYAEENIAQTDMIIEYVGEKVRQAVADIRESKYDRQGMGSSYLFRIDEDSVVDATKKGGIARFINHSCSPNCTAKIIRVDGTKRIVIYALKDIAKDAELTYDYKFDREASNDNRIPCLCGSDVCKGFLN